MKAKEYPVLVTGATGFVGTNLVRDLVSKGKNVHVLIRKGSDKWRLRNVLKKVSISTVDISNEKAVQRALNKIQPAIIYHLAAHGLFLKENGIENMVESNIWGTVNILNAARELRNLKMIVNLGSSLEYGSKNKSISEIDILRPINAYGVSKAAQSLWCVYFAKYYNLPLVVLRPSLIYGPYEESRRLVPGAILSHLDNKPLNLSNPNSKKDFLYIKDLLNAIHKAVSTKNISGEVFNIASGKEYSVASVVKLVSKITETKIPLNWGVLERRKWDRARSLYDISKSRDILGWKSEYKLKDGIEETVKWFKDNRKLYG